MMTPRQYVLMQVLRYPTLYNAPSYELASFAVFDQTFNVLGNGLCWKTFEKQLSQPVPDDLEEQALKYISGKQLYYGCKSPVEFSNGILMPGSGNDKIRAVEEDKHLYPDVKLWYKCSPCPERFVPYPNFSHRFSFVYNIKFKQLTLEWIEAAEQFYTKCLDYFNNDCSDYAYAFPNVSKYEHDNMIRNIIEMMHAYPTPEDKYKCFELPYDNDPEEFLTIKWQRDLELIKQSINETLTYLANQK